jgi:Tol biopolymer transport system component
LGVFGDLKPLVERSLMIVMHAARFIADSLMAARLDALRTDNRREQMAKTKHFGPLAAAAGALVAVALLVLMLVVNPQPAKAAFPGQNGRIAFASNRLAPNTNMYEIYTVSSTGMEVNLVRRTFDPAFDTEPAYSPNGNRIAFQSDRSGNWDIWTVTTTGTPNLTRITNNPAVDRDPNWSPDGSRIVFSSNRGGGNEQIWEVGSTGTEVNPDQITDAPADHRRPAYSPDGNRIVFQYFGGISPVQNWNIWTATPNNPRSYERITGDLADDEEPAYSPDRSRIAFASERFGPPPNVDIFSTSPGGVDRDLFEITTFHTAVDEKPAFSPDGSKIVFDSNRSGLPNDPDNYDIFIVNCSFQRPTFTQITNNPATDYAADWQSLP